MTQKDDDFTEELFVGSTHDYMLFMAALGRAAALGHLIALQAVDAALVRHKQHIIMRRTDKKFLGEVVVLLGHAIL